MIVYAFLPFCWETIVLAVTAFASVALLLGVLAWIGYTMARTPPPEPIVGLPETDSEEKPE